MNPAGVLMPDRVGQLNLRFLGPLAFEDVQIGAAHARTPDLHDDIEGSGRGGHRHLRHFEVLVVAHYLDGSHGAHGCSFSQRGIVSVASGTNAGSRGAADGSAG